jgi:hypothetical protein
MKVGDSEEKGWHYTVNICGIGSPEPKRSRNKKVK